MGLSKITAWFFGTLSRFRPEGASGDTGFVLRFFRETRIKSSAGSAEGLSSIRASCGVVGLWPTVSALLKLTDSADRRYPEASFP